jgi:hypothetical protein
METNSTKIRYSRYVSGGSAEVGQKTIEWWDREYFTTNPDDQVYVVERRFANRLDLIAATFLDEPRYWWVIAMYNNILDPHNEVTEGTIIYVPTRERVKTLLSGKLGGFPSTREVPPTIMPIV